MRNDLRRTQAQRRLQDDRVRDKFNENGQSEANLRRSID